MSIDEAMAEVEAARRDVRVANDLEQLRNQLRVLRMDMDVAESENLQSVARLDSLAGIAALVSRTAGNIVRRS